MLIMVGIMLGFMIVAGVAVSLILAAIDEHVWIIAPTSAGFILMLVGVAIYDKAYARDLRRAS